MNERRSQNARVICATCEYVIKEIGIGGMRRRSSQELRRPKVTPINQPTRVAVDEPAVRVDGEFCWLYAANDAESKLLLDVELFSRHQNRRSWLANGNSALVNEAGSLPRRRSCIDWCRITISQGRWFWRMASAI